MKLLEYDALKAKGIKWSKAHLWRQERDGKFPKRVPYGERSHGWVETEIDEWIGARAAEREGARICSTARLTELTIKCTRREQTKNGDDI